MTKTPKKVTERLSKQVGVFQRVLKEAKDRDVNESDTVTIITDMLGSLFGFDKYTEVTSEQAIRGTFCDLAVKIDGSIKYLIEVKAIGLNLKENHLRQTVNYGANAGIQWVVLTNGVMWEIFKIKFEKPIGHDLVCSFDFLELSSRDSDDIDRLFLLCKEGLSKAAIEEFHQYTQIVNRFTLAALIGSDSVLNLLRRELKRLSPTAKVSQEDLEELLLKVLKREVVEGEEAQQARRLVQRSAKKTLRKKQKKSDSPAEEQDAHVETTSEQSDSTPQTETSNDSPEHVEHG